MAPDIKNITPSLRVVRPSAILGIFNGENSKISTKIAVVLVVLAALADLCTLIPGVGDAVGPIFWGFLTLYLWHAGCGFVRPKRLASSIGSTIVELIPGFQALPTILVGTILVIAFIRAEEASGLSSGKNSSEGNQSLNQRGVREAQTTEPYNKDGVREPRG